MVHLRSVSLRGFKSFARPTELQFEPGVTVIIGPNGSGKSNIADAVLWVLGEQSPANLRGRSMQDVIFSGPGGRKSSAVAEVSLVFDNGTDSLPLDFDQIEVTRRVTRDSGSEYRLNGSGCRLLDVQDLFGGMGLGREMHSVISQGKVDSLLNSTPEARRALIEEAAGLARFKKRRERAQVKLERTRQNLLRVGDVEREVKSALRPLRQQVVAAERFAEATEEWALARSKALLLAFIEVRKSALTTQGEIEAAESRMQELSDALSTLRRERAAEEERFAAALGERERLSAAFHSVRADAEQVEARAAALRQRLARAEGELDRANRRLASARSETAVASARLTEASTASADEERLRRVTAWTESLKRRLEETLPAYREAAKSEDELKDGVFELESDRSRGLQNRDFLRREIDERGRVGAELAGAAETAATRLAQLEVDAVDLQTKAEAARLAMEQAEAALRAAAIGREEAREAADEAAHAEAAIVERLAGLEARQAVLTDVLARREGAPAGVRQLLAAGTGWRSLTEVLTVKPGYERALAAALGALVQAVVAPEGTALLDSLEAAGPLEALRTMTAAEVGEGRGARSEAEPPRGTVDLWELVSGPEDVIRSLRSLMPPTAVKVAAEESPRGGEAGGAGNGLAVDAGWQIVTTSGEMVQKGLHAARRQEVGAETVLRSRNELQAVADERERSTVERGAAAARVGQVAETLTDAERRYREQEEMLHAAQRALTAQIGDCDLHTRRQEQARVQAVEVETRKERESGLTDRYRADLTAVERVIASREAELEKARAELRALQARLVGMRENVSRLEDKKSQAALVEVRLRERCRSHENDRARAVAQKEAAEHEVVRYDRRVKAFEAYLPVLAALLAVTDGVAQKARATAVVLEESLTSTRERTEDVAGAIRHRGGVEAEIQADMQKVTNASTELRVSQALLQDRLSALEEELAELKRRHLSPRSVTEEQLGGEDDESLAAAVERAERRRERIGPINPLAEQECTEMEERAKFLAEQRGDLEASLRQLQDVITELDDHIETNFGEIFESARQHFSSVVASVFPGAKGNLKLTEPKRGRAAAGGANGDGASGVGVDDGSGESAGVEDGAEQPPGIDIEVKFPNKSPRSLTLLSGGEKAMTAIAFLFSLFLARPCPFYLLDEVEASLDDINIRRFLTLVRRYRDKTQFIIITHQRQTMEVADTLYGVTLESDGTSRVLSRRLVKAKGE
jgi:chromosome segregation protein